MNKKGIFVLFAALFFQGCIHSYYVPNVQNIPLLKEKGEFQLSGHLGGGEFSGSVEMQTAVAVSNNIGLTANYMNNRNENLDKTDYTRGNYIEAAIGYFRSVKQNALFEVYGGIGSGSQNHQYKTMGIDYEVIYTRYNKAELSYTRLYLQPAWGYRFNSCELAFSTRLSSLAFTDFTNNLNRDGDIYSDLLSLTEQNHLLIEPGITFRVGLENIKAQLQYIYSGNLKNNSRNLFEKQHISIGFVFSMQKKKGPEGEKEQEL